MISLTNVSNLVDNIKNGPCWGYYKEIQKPGWKQQTALPHITIFVDNDPFTKVKLSLFKMLCIPRRLEVEAA